MLKLNGADVIVDFGFLRAMGEGRATAKCYGAGSTEAPVVQVVLSESIEAARAAGRGHCEELARAEVPYRDRKWPAVAVAEQVRRWAAEHGPVYLLPNMARAERRMVEAGEAVELAEGEMEALEGEAR